MFAMRALQVPLSGLSGLLYVWLRQTVRQSYEFLGRCQGEERARSVERQLMQILESRKLFGGPIATKERFDEKMSRSAQATAAVRESQTDLWDNLAVEHRPLFFFGMYIASFNFNARMALVSPRVFTVEGPLSLRSSYTSLMLEGRPLLLNYLSVFSNDPRASALAKEPMETLCTILHTEPHLPDKSLGNIIQITDRALAKVGYESVSRPIARELSLMYDRSQTPPNFESFWDPHIHDLLQRSHAKEEEYLATDSVSSLTSAIEIGERALERAALESPLYAVCLADLAGYFLERFKRNGNGADLEASISRTWHALQKTDWTMPTYRSLLSNLGLALSTRYGHGGPTTDLDAAIDSLEQAVEGTWSTSGEVASDMIDGELWKYLAPRRLLWQTNYANALRKRSLNRRWSLDLDHAIQCFRMVLAATGSESMDLAIHRQNLANALVDRFRLSRSASDLNEAIELLDAATAVATLTSDLGYCYHSVANALKERFDLDGQVSDSDLALEFIRRAVNTMQSVDIGAALSFAATWGDWAFELGDWKQSVAGYRTALDIGDELFQLQLVREAKESWLQPLQGVVAAYAFAQIQSALVGTPDRQSELFEDAVSTLEHGLGRILAQSLELNQKDLNSLKALGHADLFERYQSVASRIAEAIDNPWGIGQSSTMNSPSSRVSVDGLRAALRQAIDDVRAVPGYEGFLKPIGSADIQEIVKNFAVVYLISTSKGGLGIVIEQGTGSIHPVRLNAMTDAWTRESVLNLLRIALEIKSGTCSHRDFIEFVEKLTSQLGEHLASLSASKVVLDQAAIIPVGLLALLPLHAAKRDDQYFLDQCLVSFSPNARSLLSPRRDSRPENLLAIATPEKGLPYTADEVAVLRNYFEGGHVLTGSEATVENARKQIGRHTVLHFSCHASADVLQPLRSALRLQGGDLTLSDLLAMGFRNVTMAVLSACESGVPGLTVPEEVVSLPSALLQGGVRSVISTLWSVEDAATAMLMIRFYHNWRREGQYPLAALIAAQKWIRDTTNVEKLSFFQREGAERLTEHLERKVPTEKSYASPWYWAGFTWIGAR